MVRTQAVTGADISHAVERPGFEGKPSLAWANYGASSTYFTDLDGVAREARLSGFSTRTGLC